ncbi:MAG TPA: NlpC/P60 family protein [Gammaproteobacteria bacterium]|nr:NlpC/P60 family protein [Gammaproteobacteria bacterium]
MASCIAYAEKNVPDAITQPVQITDIPEYSTYPVIVQELILKASRLTKMNLTYLYGSSDPKNKGMDCSGTIYYLLNQEKLHDVPRSSDEMFGWVEKQGKLYKVTNRDFNSPEFSKLKPGDLLFWSGTYVANRGQPVTHVMLYLGKNKKGDRLMFGASDGRTYQGKKMWGVSVFDFKLPDGKGPQRFEGYSCIPDLTCDK